ncbi:MAG: hypothetical protein JNJ40_14375 [Bacteroidia bacterium]|nr:hypothetical protein [Bacteroidia bacterium]
MIYRLIPFIVFISVSLQLKGQKASKAEIFWALGHPIAALKVKKIKRKAELIYNRPEIKARFDSYGSGGKLDAFRHVFFMAAFAQKISINKLRKLGIAHEKGNYRQFLKHKTENGEVPDSLSSVMDLANNEVGFTIGKTNKTKTLEELRPIVIKEILSGKALILKRNKEGRFVDCNDRVIDPLAYKEKWFVPKCLVSSK